MKDNLAVGLAVVAIVIAIIPPIVGLLSESQFSGTRYPNGISADTTLPVAGEVRGTDLTITDDAVVSGGSFTLTTSNTATSTLIVGCIQTYATSTQTPVRITATSSAAGGVPLMAVYGSCPF